MSEQPWETMPVPAVRSRTLPALIVVALLILVIGTANIIDAVRYHPKPASALALQQQREALNTALGQAGSKPDPDAFDETRDGSKALSLEDENGKASIWQDSKSGSRIFCVDSCTVLPASHHRHRHN